MGVQTYHSEEPKDRISHLVREQSSPYDKKQLVGLRFLESRKPYRSTWLPQVLLRRPAKPELIVELRTQRIRGVHS